MKFIKGFNNKYEIYEDGHIYSRKSHKFLKSHLQYKKGYLRVTLCKNNTQKMYFLHRFIAEYFLPKVKGKEFVNHKNGNKLDNRLSNLEWCTKSENAIHSYKIGTQIMTPSKWNGLKMGWELNKNKQRKAK